MKLTLFWLVTIIIGSVLLGIAVEFWGRDCEVCMKRRKKWFGWFYRNNNNPGNPGNPDYSSNNQLDQTAAMMKMVS